MRVILASLVLACAVGGMAFAQPPIDETPYDEWAESPTIILDCGEFPAVRVTVDGRELEQRGFIHQGRTFLPARETLQRLGGLVIWNREQRAFYAQFPVQDTTFRVTLGSTTAHVYEWRDGVPFGAGPLRETLSLDAAPMICEGMVFGPIRRAVEASGGTIHYDREAGMVHITTPLEIK